MPSLLRHIDFALLQTLEQIIGRQVDQLYLVGPLDDPIRHGFAHAYASDLGDHIVQAFEMLDVDGGVDIDAGLQQLLDILPALGVARPGALVCASSSTRISWGRRASAASRSNSSMIAP